MNADQELLTTIKNLEIEASNGCALPMESTIDLVHICKALYLKCDAGQKRIRELETRVNHLEKFRAKKKPTTNPY